MHDRRNHDRRNDCHRQEWRLCRHECAQPVGCRSPRGRQNKDGHARPEKRHAKCHNDCGQAARIDDGAHRGIDKDRAKQDRVADHGVGLYEGRRDTGAETDKRADGQINVIDHQDHHLSNRCQNNRNSEIKQKIKPEIAHGAWLHIENGRQQNCQRQDR